MQKFMNCAQVVRGVLQRRMVPRWDVNRKRLCGRVGVVFTESLGLTPRSESGSEELGQWRGVESSEARAGIPSKPTWSKPELSGKFAMIYVCAVG